MNYFPKQMYFVSLIFILVFLGACTGKEQNSEELDLEGTISAQSTDIAQLSTQVVDHEQINQRQWNAISHLATDMPYALGLITPIPPGVTITPTAYAPENQKPDPTPTPTPSPSIDIEYPPYWRTGIEEIDMVIDAMMSDDLAAREDLIRYTISACTTQDGLGGPPKCTQDEEDGKIVEAFPVLYSEGTHVRPEEIEEVMNFTVRGLLAVYHVPDDAYESDYWPAGDYGIVFTSEDGDFSHVVVLLIENGQIVRLDFLLPWPPFEQIWARSDEFVLPPMR
jgi:hypothetical protein